jgi:hypothetical protein
MASRVLFLTNNIHQEYWRELVRHAAHERKWVISLLCSEVQRPAYLDEIGQEGQFKFLPDFNLPMEWEKNQAEATRIRDLIRHCEEVSGIAVNRLLLAGERDIGHAYAKDMYYFSYNDTARLCRRDPTHAERIVERMFWFAEKVVHEIKPDFIVAGAVSSPLNFALSLIAEARNIPLALLRNSKIIPGRSFWTLNRNMLSTRTFDIFSERERGDAPVSGRAADYLNEFRSKPRSTAYIEELFSRGPKTWRWTHMHVEATKYAIIQFLYFVRKDKGARPKSARSVLWDFYRRKWLRFRQRSLFKIYEPDELAAMTYIFLPFHKEPEIAINFQAHFWHNQMNTVKQLSAMLPKGVKLLVREHRGTTGRRPTRYLKTLRAYPGVEVVHASDPQFKYIENADLVITDNGTTGWEAAIMGRPVIALHESSYAIGGIVNHVRDPEAIGRAILDGLRGKDAVMAKDHDKRLGWLLDSEWDATIADDGNNFDALFDLLASVLEKRQPIALKSAS